jgi:hypothetical protein
LGGLGFIVSSVWPKLLIETKENDNYYIFVNMNITTLQDHVVLTFKNFSKNGGSFNPFFNESYVFFEVGWVSKFWGVTFLVVPPN